MNYTDEEKRNMVMRYQKEEDVALICAEAGVSRSTFYSWVKRLRTNGSS